MYDSLPSNGDIEQFSAQIWELFERHQKSINKVVEEMIKNYSSQIRKGELPNNCLLRIIGSAEHTVESQIKYIHHLRKLLCDSLPIAFQSIPAKDEHHVQDIGETILNSAKEDLEREAPQLPYGVVSTKPDFSNLKPGCPSLFIEFKYLKDGKRLNAIITEMTSRVTIYRQQGASVLFIIYDPNRTIKNDQKFIEPFERNENIFVGICR